ncbi:MAG: bifunctional UDP-3-O-[3-hydroxymyristoyl] N-acetylglucosamine deacetylase/3-hydroxyacyl-ACP dehydratase [Saprospiraceae bacterium]|nr:bifunctional UDP-3-O-[3-hydroxymyristoyl] N-acetylglucosamine deacetylase/3-hydroxyacyl-ACP dehydratase [Saprospiraceae bacterium]
MVKRKLTSPASFQGIGLHTGRPINMEIDPAEAGFGIKFKRTDVSPDILIPAEINYVATTTRGTTLEYMDNSVATVEHLLSALHFFGIEDALISLDGGEVPILDGSAKLFLEGLEPHLSVDDQEAKEALVISEPFSYTDPDTGSEYHVFPADSYQLSCILEFDAPNVPSQFADMTDFSTYKEEIAPCRTFVFLSDIEKLFDQGLIKGGSIDNAIVFVDKEMNEDKKEALAIKIGKPNIRTTKQGILNTIDLTFNNEPARHKILDMVGDFSLLGRPLQAKIIAKRPGHTSNVKLVQILKSIWVEQRKNKGVPKLDVLQPGIMDMEKIKSILPHRFPFLFVDKVMSLDSESIVAVKNVSVNEAFFEGHFPGNPVFPGVLQIEALAQAGGILALSIVDEGKGDKWDTYFLKMDNVKFKSKVVPGDTLVLKLELMEPIRRGIVRMRAFAYVCNKLVSEGELTAQVVKR